MTRPITAVVYENDAVTLAGADLASSTLGSDNQREWLDDLSADGSHGFEIKLGHTDEALCVEDRVVRWHINGTARWQGLIEDLNPTFADPNNRESGRVIKVGGRGLLGEWDDAAIYPELGLGRISPDTRYMNFASLDYDDSGWTTATELKTQSDTDPSKPWYRAPRGWKDPDAVWIGPAGGDTPPVDPGDIYFRGTFTVASGEGGDYRFDLTADDGGDLYVDGNRVFSEQRAGLWGVTRQVTLQLDEGSHLVAFKLVNFDRPNPSTNVAGFILSVFRMLGGGIAAGSVISRTSGGTAMLAFPASPPGMTAGKIILTFKDEAQSRGSLPGWTCDATATQDSNGVDWPEELDESFQVGSTSIGDVIRHLVAEKKIDVAVSPTGKVLHLYVHKGEDLSGSVAAEYAVNLGRLAFKKSRVRKNVGLGKTAEGRWYEAIETDSVAAYGRREVGLSVGGAPSDAAAQRQISAYFTDNAFPLEAITDMQLEVVTAEPYVDFTVGDTITSTDSSGGTSTYRVHGLRVTEDEAGQPIFTPELVKES